MNFGFCVKYLKLTIYVHGMSIIILLFTLIQIDKNKNDKHSII